MAPTSRSLTSRGSVATLAACERLVSTGKCALHPSQVEALNEMFSLTAEGVERNGGARQTCRCGRQWRRTARRRDDLRGEPEAGGAGGGARARGGVGVTRQDGRVRSRVLSLHGPGADGL